MRSKGPLTETRLLVQKLFDISRQSAAQYMPGPKLLSHDEFILYGKAVGINNGERYKTNGAQSSDRIPTHPFKVYSKWDGWSTVIPHKKRPSARVYNCPPISDFVRIVIQAQVINRTDYRNRRLSIASNLPSDPRGYYGDQWPGWGGITNTRVKFFTLEECIAVSKQAKIIGVVDYKNRRKSISLQLHSSPQTFYPDWPGWQCIIGNTREACR